MFEWNIKPARKKKIINKGRQNEKSNDWSENSRRG